MDDASLDDFVESEDERSEASESERRPEGAVSSETDQQEAANEASSENPPAEDDEQSVAPAETTYQWSAEGVICTACGSEVHRRWQTDEGLVCPDCKEW